MGYWGYEATASDSALDYLANLTEHLEKMWDEARDYGQKMAVVYVLTEAPAVDMTDYRGLKAKAVEFIGFAITNAYEAHDAYLENSKIEYLQGLVRKLQTKQGTTLLANLETA